MMFFFSLIYIFSPVGNADFFTSIGQPTYQTRDVDPSLAHWLAQYYFKAQNVIGANYSSSYWKFSSLFSGGWCELYYWEKLMQIELKAMYHQIQWLFSVIFFLITLKWICYKRPACNIDTSSTIFLRKASTLQWCLMWSSIGIRN